MRRLALLSVGIALVGLAGCSDKTTGSAVPGAPQVSGSTTNEPTETPSSTPTGGAGSLTDVDPCALLTSDGQAKLGVSGGEKHDVGSGRGCQWQVRAQDGNLHIFTVSVYDKVGIKDLPKDLVINNLPDIGNHHAVQNPAKQGGACSVVMGVTDSSRVTATAVAGTDVQLGCQLAMQLAQYVEPGLP